MRTRVQKWGNSLALRIPKAFAEEAQLQEDAAVDLVVEGGALVARRAESEGALTLDDLLEGMTEANVHPEVDWGPPVGREVW
jgi:antitoxin MazE